MYASKIVAVFTFAMAASAALTARQAQGNQCGNTGKISCCNPSDQDVAASGLLSTLTPTLAAGTCSPPPLDVGVSDPSAICGGNTAYCCDDTTTNQNGLINLSTTCSPIALGDLLGLL